MQQLPMIGVRAGSRLRAHVLVVGGLSACGSRAGGDEMSGSVGSSTTQTVGSAAAEASSPEISAVDGRDAEFT